MQALLVIIRRWEHTVPNFITLFRLLLCLWGLHTFYWVVFVPSLIVLLCLISVGLDGIDGYYARRYNQVSFSGKVLDPLVDKVCCWNIAAVLANYFFLHTEWPTIVLMLLAVPPIFLIALYDYATMSMRATDEQMMTSEVAKWKQGVLFTALVLFLVAIAFRDAAGYFGNDTLVWCLDMTYCVFLVGGILTLWQALRLTAESARSYFRSSTDPRAQEWARVALIAFVLRRI